MIPEQIRTTCKTSIDLKERSRRQRRSSLMRCWLGERCSCAAKTPGRTVGTGALWRAPPALPGAHREHGSTALCVVRLAGSPDLVATPLPRLIAGGAWLRSLRVGFGQCLPGRPHRAQGLRVAVLEDRQRKLASQVGQLVAVLGDQDHAGVVPERCRPSILGTDLEDQVQ